MRRYVYNDSLKLFSQNVSKIPRTTPGISDISVYCHLTLMYNINCHMVFTVFTSVSDPYHFDLDPDPR